MTEFAPGGSKPKMTQSQIKRYIKELEEKRQKAQQELQKAQLQWELSPSPDELKDLEQQIDELL